MIAERAAQVASLAFLALVWYAGVEYSDGILPTFGEVWETLWRLLSTGDFLAPFWSTLVRAAVGFLIGFTTGIAYGIAAGRSRPFATASTGLVTVLLFMPTLVIIFLGLVILGFASSTVVIICAVTVFPKVAIYVRDVVRGIDPEVLAMARSYKLTMVDRYRRIYLPYLIPVLLTLARIGFTLAWKMALLTEVLGYPGGIGLEISLAYIQYDLATMVAWLCVFIIAVLIYEQGLRAFERAVVRWR